MGLVGAFTWKPRGLSKSVKSRVTNNWGTPFKLLITLLITYGLSLLGI